MNEIDGCEEIGLQDHGEKWFAWVHGKNRWQGYRAVGDTPEEALRNLADVIEEIEKNE